MKSSEKTTLRREILGKLREMSEEERGKLFDRILDTWCLTCAQPLDDDGICLDCENEEDEDEDEDEDDFEDEDTDDEVGDDNPPDEEDSDEEENSDEAGGT